MKPLLATLSVLLAGCGTPMQSEPEPADFTVTLHSNRGENWTDYTCSATVQLARPSDAAIVSDDLTVEAGRESQVTLTVDRAGAYTLTFSAMWQGTAPGTSWHLVSGPWGDTLSVSAPGSHRIECP